MNLKTATLIALIGIGVAFVWTVVDGFLLAPSQIYLIRRAIYDVPLMLFLFTLYRKQT